MLEKGMVEIYTGDGKGKTTAAFGLALRAAGHGNKVLIYQFLKPPELQIGERIALETKISRITVQALDIPWNMKKSKDNPNAVAKTKTAISNVLAELAQTTSKGLYDVLILDEIIYCLKMRLAKLEDVKRIIRTRAAGVEIILTGQGAGKKLMAMADIVTEMKNIRHPFKKGLAARKGIEY